MVRLNEVLADEEPSTNESAVCFPSAHEARNKNAYRLTPKAGQSHVQLETSVRHGKVQLSFAWPHCSHAFLNAKRQDAAARCRPPGSRSCLSLEK